MDTTGMDEKELRRQIKGFQLMLSLVHQQRNINLDARSRQAEQAEGNIKTMNARVAEDAKSYDRDQRLIALLRLQLRDARSDASLAEKKSDAVAALLRSAIEVNNEREARIKELEDFATLPHPDTARLNRIFQEPLERREIIMVINKYGKGAAGNSAVSIDDVSDIDVVLKNERAAQEKKS